MAKGIRIVFRKYTYNHILLIYFFIKDDYIYENLRLKTTLIKFVNYRL